MVGVGVSVPSLCNSLRIVPGVLTVFGDVVVRLEPLPITADTVNPFADGFRRDAAGLKGLVDVSPGDEAGWRNPNHRQQWRNTLTS